MAYGLLDPRLMGAPQRMSGGLLDMPMGGGIGPGEFPPPPQPGAMPQQMPPQSQGGGFLEGLFGGGGDPNYALMALGQGIAGGDVAGAFGQYAPIMAKGRERNATKKWLMNKGMSPEDADIYASNPTLLNEALQGKKRNLVNAGDGNLYDADSGEWISAPNSGQGKPTDDMREYMEGVKQGFTGTFMDWQIKMKEAGRNQIDINTGEKLPTGFRWKNPDQKELGVEPIPGGPGEQIPGELAARVGVADTFLARLPSIKERVKQGQVTGVWDRAKAGAGYGESAALFNDIETGADVLQRFLTGAGMPASEAAEYTRRYKPTYMDTPETVIGKLDRLEQELRAAKEMAMRGRGGAQTIPGGGNVEEMSDEELRAIVNGQ